MELIQDIQNAFLPELIIFVSIIINIVLALFIRKNAYKLSKIITFVQLALAGAAVFYIQINPCYYAFNDVYVSNAYTSAFKIMILLSSLFVIISSPNLIREKRQKSFEFFSVFLTGILSAFSLVSSNDFISAFISMEFLGLTGYFLCSYRKNHKSKEAALKYLITGSSASAVFLFGVSYLFGLCGNINFISIGEIFSSGGINILFVIACLLIILALMFKFGCFPFNNWIIDIYEGSSYPICAYLSLIPKIAAFAFISRLFVYIFSLSPLLQIITAFLALFSIIYAAAGAIKQTNIKRIYAYSSVIHSGFILLAVSVLTVYSVSAAIFYIFSYIFMNMGIWTASIIYTTEYKTDEAADYAGLFYKRPYFAAFLSICLISLAGLPISGGFISKLYLFTALSRADFIFSVILFFALLACAVCIFVYFNIIKVFYKKPSNAVFVKPRRILPELLLCLCASVTVLTGIFPDLLIKLSQIISYYSF